MDRTIFDRLDMLERAARVETRQPSSMYDNISAENSGYDIPEMMQDGSAGYSQVYQPAEDEFADLPMALDAFDEQLLQQPDYTSRHGQAALGRARLSLPPGMTQMAPRDRELNARRPLMSQETSHPQNFDLSRFALHSGQHASSTSSPDQQPLPSSPAFKASQRRSGLMANVRPAQPSFGENSPLGPQELSEHQPLKTRPREEEKRNGNLPPLEAAEPHMPEHVPAHPSSKTNELRGGPPVVQGINLVSTHALPDRLRAIFPYPLFNAVQSKSFESIYKTNDNFVLSAPTGSGKTAVLELAICRLINSFANGTYKIVYQAPTKSLCSERQRDWQAKFGPLDLQCAELTGDTDNAQLRNVAHATIIITTPEKWDSMTRKWKDQQKLMQMVKLFLIDEVHILKEDRGATLEAVVSRMKSVGSDVRFVALSATVPNSQDVAIWLGKGPNNPESPATRERFGEEFRPVRLQKHVCGYQTNSNDFAFDKTLNTKLPDVIAKWSQRKPIMIFCFTRNACTETAKLLANWWNTNGPRERYWSSPRKRMVVADKDLCGTILSGVAFHHAGLSIQDRSAVEKGYVEGDIQVICSTSTLAVGVNLPCNMVIIKNTVTYQNPAGGCKEYSDLEIMQMLGRAGRPQFDDNAVAVIMTRLQRVPHYEKMISGQETLESCLHRNLIDHLNAEIGLGTIDNALSAKKWLMGTFLFVRLKENPGHYKIEGDAPGRTLDERLEVICKTGISLLERHELIMGSPKLQCTEFGDAMARYYLQFDTMRLFLELDEKAKVSEILSVISQAAEFREIRFRAGEKTAYKDLNKNGSIKFPIPVNLDAPAHKVSLIIQSVLGVVDLPTEDPKHRVEFNTAKGIIFQHANRLIRCIVDCKSYCNDAVATRNALMLARSLGAQVWDDSPLHMKQLETVGIVYVRKLVAAGINSIEDIEITEPHRIEGALSRNPPFGSQLQDKAKAFPKLRVSIRMMGEPVIKKGESVKVNLKAEIGFLNEKVPEVFQRKPIYVCLLVETSDGKKVHFARISANKLNKGQYVLFSAHLTNATQSVRAYVMCDEIAGTLRHANLKPDIPPAVFPPPKGAEETDRQKASANHAQNSAKRRASAGKGKDMIDSRIDEFGDEDIDDADLTRAEAGVYIDIDTFDNGRHWAERPKRKKRKMSDVKETNERNATTTEDGPEPHQLANGKWLCNHPCKDKTACKHLCCREGLDKPPKPPKTSKPKDDKQQSGPGFDPKQTQLNMSVSKKNTSLPRRDHSSGKGVSEPAPHNTDTSREASKLNRLHNSIKTETPRVPTMGRNRSMCVASPLTTKPGKTRLSFLEAARSVKDEDTSDYGNDIWDSNDVVDVEESVYNPPASRTNPPPGMNGPNENDDEMLDMMDDGFEDPPHSAPSYDGHGESNIDSSIYFGGNLADNYELLQAGHSFDDDTTGPQSTTMPQTANGGDVSFVEKINHLFVGESSDSAAHDLGLNATEYEQKHSVNDADLNQLDSFPASKKQKTTSRLTSAQLHDETERLDRVLQADDFLVEAAEASAAAEQEEAQPEKGMTPDEMREWFEAEYGTELFNYTGA